jgi:small subunit ribosomal protein S5
LSKSLGSKNAANVVKATLSALMRLRLREDIYESRGLALKQKTETPPVLPVEEGSQPAAEAAAARV